MECAGSERVADPQRATAILNDVPKLIAQATDQERRALLVEVFDDIYLTPHQAMAVRPAAAYTVYGQYYDEDGKPSVVLMQWKSWQVETE